jgi:hypothetical protein
MLYREIIAVCSQFHTKHINTLCGQNVELLNVKLAVHTVTNEAADHICSFNAGTCRNPYADTHPNFPVFCQPSLVTKSPPALSVLSKAYQMHCVIIGGANEAGPQNLTNEWIETDANSNQTDNGPSPILLGISVQQHRGWIGRFHHSGWHWLQLWLVHTWEGVSEWARQTVWPSGRSRDPATIYNHPHSIIYRKIFSRRPISVQSKSLELKEEDTAALRMNCGTARPWFFVFLNVT